MRQTSRTIGVFAGVIAGSLVVFGNALARAADWPQWRGENRDGGTADFTPPPAWPKTLASKWKTPVGLGDATPALVGDRLYVFAGD